METLHRTRRIKVALPCRTHITPRAPQRMMSSLWNVVLDCVRARARSLLAYARGHHDRAHFHGRYHHGPVWHAVSSSVRRSLDHVAPSGCQLSQMDLWQEPSALGDLRAHGVLCRRHRRPRTPSCIGRATPFSRLPHQGRSALSYSHRPHARTTRKFWATSCGFTRPMQRQRRLPRALLKG